MMRMVTSCTPASCLPLARPPSAGLRRPSLSMASVSILTGKKILRANWTGRWPALRTWHAMTTSRIPQSRLNSTTRGDLTAPLSDSAFATPTCKMPSRRSQLCSPRMPGCTACFNSSSQRWLRIRMLLVLLSSSWPILTRGAAR
ncbi:hypothetical protein MPH_05021 [Macrophomina phaseolina MS6]|uniref:Uncharacterized protein n=1 Tax=Macrophomina phaseolina (strain MS6) TaxID=1126212 RepID=K2R5S7_MACPH|nr:hypothetical protein MPH_05021 [Macrophomina phaseolina MS6]